MKTLFRSFSNLPILVIALLFLFMVSCDDDDESSYETENPNPDTSIDSNVATTLATTENFISTISIA